jgi:hypothetical protein
MITASKYHPNIAAAKKLPPVPTSNVAPTLIPFAVVQKALPASKNPSVALMKINTKTILVRREQARKTKAAIELVWTIPEVQTGAWELSSHVPKTQGQRN